MKIVNLRRSLAVGIVMLTASSGVASTNVISGFDDISSVTNTWRFDFGGSGTVSWNSSEDADSNPASGALQLDFDFPYAGGIAFTSDQFAEPGVDWSAAEYISFDMKVDPGSAFDAFENNGYAQFVLRDGASYDWVELWGDNVAVGGWMHIEAPLLGAYETVRALTVQLYGGPSQNLPGAVTLYLDNITLIGLPATVVLEDVIEEWNFTGGSTNSESGLALNYYFNEDTSGNDWYNVTTNGWGWETSLTNLTAAWTNTDELIIAITLNDYDFSASSNQNFSIELLDGAQRIADIWLDALPAGVDPIANPLQTTIQGNVGSDWAGAGTIATGVTHGAVTYGLTLDFDGGTLGTGSYNYWTGSPGQWELGHTWGSTIGESGDLNLTGVTVDSLKIFIEDHVAGDRLGIDQIKVYKRSEVLLSAQSLYALWLADYQPALGANTNFTDNPDNDLLPNLSEYGLNGNPTIQDTGYASTYQTVEEGGTNYIEYIHVVREDANFRALEYYLETTTDLIMEGWTNTGYTVTGTNLLYASGFYSVTNLVPMNTKDKQYIRLTIEENF